VAGSARRFAGRPRHAPRSSRAWSVFPSSLLPSASGPCWRPTLSARPPKTGFGSVFFLPSVLILQQAGAAERASPTRAANAEAIDPTPRRARVFFPRSREGLVGPTGPGMGFIHSPAQFEKQRAFFFSFRYNRLIERETEVGVFVPAFVCPPEPQIGIWEPKAMSDHTKFEIFGDPGNLFFILTSCKQRRRRPIRALCSVSRSSSLPPPRYARK